MCVLIFRAQGHINDDEEVGDDPDEYDDIAEFLDGYDDEEDGAGEADGLEKTENTINDLVELILCDGERILEELDEAVGDEDQAVSQDSGSPQVEGLQSQHLLTIRLLYYQGSPLNWQASIFRATKRKIPPLKVCSVSVC